MYWIEQLLDGEWWMMSDTITDNRLAAKKALELHRCNKGDTYRLVNQMCMVNVEAIGRKFNTTTRSRINE